MRDDQISNSEAADAVNLNTAASRSTPTLENISASTVTITQEGNPRSANEGDIIPLTLRARPTVTWDETVQDNEGLGRKSSKRCCIFHKPRAFGESSSDSSDDDSVGSGSSSSSGGGFPSDKKPKNKNNRGPIARPKETKKVPAYQRFHA